MQNADASGCRAELKSAFRIGPLYVVLLPPCRSTTPNGTSSRRVQGLAHDRGGLTVGARAQVSDDSDIEGHPNVDHKSLVRWKQRDIHEKRQQRKHKITQLEAELACNKVILTRLDKVADDTAAQGADGPAFFSRLVEQLKRSPAPDKPKSGAANQPTYDALLEASLMRTFEALKNKGVTPGDPKFAEKLVQAIRDHTAEFRAADAEQETQLAVEVAEQKKKITSDDIHDGFESAVSGCHMSSTGATCPLPALRTEPGRVRCSTATWHFIPSEHHRLSLHGEPQHALQPELAVSTALRCHGADATILSDSSFLFPRLRKLYFRSHHISLLQTHCSRHPACLDVC